MKINTVRIKNINSLQGEFEIDFDAIPLRNSGIFAITGETGAGKTTILDAITLALYAEIPRQSEVTDVLTFGENEGYAKVIFENNSDVFIAEFLIRKKGKNGNIDITRGLGKWDKKKEKFVGIAEKKNEIKQLVTEVSGLDYARFLKSVMLAQGDFAAFINANDKERSDLLESLTGTEVYSQISKNAFERAKLEREKLEILQNNYQGLAILTDTELEVIQEELKKLDTAIAENVKTLGVFSEKKNLLLRRSEVAKSLEDFEKKNQELEEKKLFFDEIQNVLKRQTEMSPLATELSFLKNQKSELAIFEEKVKKNEEDFSNVKNQNEEINHFFEDLEKKEQTFLAKKKLTLPLLEKAISFQNDLEKVVQNLEEKEKEKVFLEQKIEQNKSEKESFLVLEKKQKSEKINLENWFLENKKYESLRDFLPKILANTDALRDALKNKINEESKKNKAKEDLIFSEKKYENFDKQLKDNILELEKLENELEKIGFEKGKNRIDLSKEIELEIAETKLKIASAKNLLEITKEQKETIDELHGYEQKFNILASTENFFYKDILSKIDQINELQNDYDFREKTFRLHNYEAVNQLRKSLKESEVCAVCFSTHHPINEMSEEQIAAHDDFTKKAYKEFEKIKILLEKAKSEYHLILKDQENLRSQMHNFILKKELKYEGKIEEAHKKIDQFEAKGTRIREDVGADFFKIFKLEQIENHIEKLSVFLENIEKKQADFEQIGRKTNEIETNIGALKLDISKIDGELNIHKKSLQDAENQLIVHQQKFDEIEILLNKDLAFFEQKFDLNEFKSTLLFLEEKNKNFIQNSLILNNLEKEIIEQKGKIETIDAFLKITNENLSKINLLLLEKKEEKAKLATQIFELCADKNPIVEKQFFEAETERFLTEIKEKRIEKNEKNAEFVKFQAELENDNITFKKNQSALENTENALIKKVQKLSFENLEIFENQILSKEKIEEYSEQIAIFQKEKIAAKTSLSNAKTEYLELEKSTQNFEKIEDILLKINELEEFQNEGNQAIGAYKEKLENDKKQRKNSLEILEKIEKQGAEMLRWKALNDLIGSADGKKFRVFAQSLTLRQLVILANLHLDKLSGRYIIENHNDDSLLLDIIDTWQGDNRRSMKTLSGGESFLVSLALALGLSEMAGRNTQIRSLFIDEGFGTLDEDTLNTAIITLDNLQSQGKTIGVISHVKELKEKISTQIQIKRKGNGMSFIEIV